MPWPGVTASSDHINEGSDEPRLARQEILELIYLVNLMIGSRGGTSGVCDLDESRRIPGSRLPTVPVSAGGTGGTTTSAARSNLGLGNAATKTVGASNGVAGLDSNAEVSQLPSGASAASDSAVLYSNGDWAAPYPAGSAWITQGMLKTASGEISGGTGNYVLPGGKFGLYPQCRADSTGDSANIYLGFSLGTTNWYTSVALENLVGSGTTARVRQEYIQSSPPYDLGDGEVPLFVFALFHDNELSAVYEAQEPPWALNGPTDIHSGMKLPQVSELLDFAKREQFFERLDKGQVEVIEGEQERKQADMPLIPHPFLDQGKVVLVDPVGDEVLRLAELQRHGYSVQDWIEAGALKIDNTPLPKRHGPPGVDIVRAKWK